MRRQSVFVDGQTDKWTLLAKRAARYENRRMHKAKKSQMRRIHVDGKLNKFIQEHMVWFLAICAKLYVRVY